MLRSPTEKLKFCIGLWGGFDKELCSKRKVVKVVFHLQALQFEYGINCHEDVVALCRHSARW